MTAPTLHLFPGAHKTATTLLQRALELRRPELEARGYAIARRRAFYAEGMKNTLRIRKQAARTPPDELRRRLESVFGRDPQSCDVVISIENAFGERPGIYASAGCSIDNLRTLFPRHRIQVTFYIRRQDDFLESAYIQSVQSGREVDLETFIGRFDGVTIDWGQILEPVVRRLGPEHVSVVTYETIRNGVDAYIASFFDHFVDAGEIDPPREAELQGRYTNMTLSATGLEAALAAFATLPDRLERRRRVKALQREYGVDKYPRFRLPLVMRKAIADRHYEANAALIRSGVLPARLHDHYLFADV